MVHAGLTPADAGPRRTRGFRVSEIFCRILANLKPEHPLHRTESHDEPNRMVLSFFPVRVRVNNPHSFDMGARVSEPPEILLARSPPNTYTSILINIVPDNCFLAYDELKNWANFLEGIKNGLIFWA